ncbi:condensin complex subunit 2, partial [Tremellales sp. Uapishka_1]
MPTSDAPAHLFRKPALTSDPSRLNQMNDDAAERANRRKSAHFGPDVAQEKRVGSVLDAQAKALRDSANGKKAKRLSSVQQDPVAQVSREDMNKNFEEWMKLSTDNKITVTNTWNFALIDYFADLTLLRNGPDDQSINFQKASCTLDGCVKIWTSRVDSVATETGKLLSGLAGGGGDDEGDDGEEGAEGDEEGTGKIARKSHRSEATLAKTFASLQVKKFDLEFTVDPLFKKTSADFDEGGAGGLLMNHLGVDGKGRVVFDAGDAGIEEEDEEEDQAEEEMVELEKLREFIPDQEQLEELNISETLADFRFSSDPTNMPDFSTLLALSSSFNDEDPHAESSSQHQYVAGGDEVDFFGDDDFGGALGGGGGEAMDVDQGGYDEDDQPQPDYGGTGHLRGAVGMAIPGEGLAPFDPRRPGGELVMAMTNDRGEDDIFDYFDKGWGKGWAGVEHWKLRKVSRKDATPAPTTKAAKTAKTPFAIDFASPSTSATASKTLFAPATRASTQLPSTKPVSTGSRRSSKKTSTGEMKRKREEWLLPDDMHFSSRQLLRLFLKPKFSLRMRRSTRSTQIAENPNEEIDENFWAQAAAERAEAGDALDETMEGMGNAAIPFESQFFHDDGDGDGDGDIGMDIIAEEEDDLWAGTQGIELKRAKPENVNFAKKAKRVDVKRLKDDIWSGLKVLVPERDKDIAESEDDFEIPSTPQKEGPPQTFDAVIQNLRSTYPRDKMSEISTSFCFICLLHLANEEGLRIETDRFDDNLGDVGCMGEADVDMDDIGVGMNAGKGMGEKSDRIVGELQALKVYKDPNAGRSA